MEGVSSQVECQIVNRLLLEAIYSDRLGCILVKGVTGKCEVVLVAKFYLAWQVTVSIVYSTVVWQLTLSEIIHGWDSPPATCYLNNQWIDNWPNWWTGIKWGYLYHFLLICFYWLHILKPGIVYAEWMIVSQATTFLM